MPDLAAELFAAYLDGTARVAAPSGRGGAFDMNAAYATEAAVAQLHIARGARPVGVKVGYANKAMWRVLKLDTLVWAHMYADTVHYVEEGQGTLALPYYRAPKIEPEIVFKLRDTIPEGADAAATLAAVEWLAPGFEIIDCPFTEPQFQPADFVAAWGLHLALVIGERVAIEPGMIPELAEALAKFKVRLSKDGELMEEGGGRNSLRSPALCLSELASAMARRGTPLAAGDLISSGTLTAGSPIAAGETWTAEFDGVSVATLRLNLK